MLTCDALIVGGGPAGSTCARALRRAGWDVAVMDRARFPRDKVCAGWLTPRVFDRLELDPGEYRAAGLTLQDITAFQTAVAGGHAIETRYDRVVSYAIRRCEFDAFLLRRAAVRVLDGAAVSTLRRQAGAWVVNDAVRTPIVVGAGGHFCPVARHIGRDGRSSAPVVAKEAEYPLEGERSLVRSDTPELFFSRDLEGYGWCVRKGSYLNVGLGRRAASGFPDYLAAFTRFLEESGKAPGASRARWRGHAYLAAGAGSRTLVGDGVLLIGDAAGLAWPASGEGICPAIESAVQAAGVLIAAGGRAAADDLRPYEARARAAHPDTRPAHGVRAEATRAIGRALMRSRAFTRHVLLDRWFLRRDEGDSGVDCTDRPSTDSADHTD